MVKVDASFIKKLEEKLLKINNSNIGAVNIKGDIGEAFVKDGIKYCLWEKKLNVGKIGNNKFSIKEHYKSDKRGIGGIDFYLKFKVNGIRYSCFIEVKNWKKYTYITPKTFNEHILDRFTKHDSKKRHHRIVVMNKRNIRLIQAKCLLNDIHIIPLEEHITSMMLNINKLQIIMDYFVKDFNIFIDDIISGNIQINSNKYENRLKQKMIGAYQKIYKKYQKICEKCENLKKRFKYRDKSKSNKTEKIKNAIRKGWSYSYIAEEYDTTIEYIQKIKSIMVKDGEKLPDRRTKEWCEMQYITKDDIE